MTTPASTWNSLTGRRGVDIGTSFTRAWNERTGKTTNRSKGYPNPEYYSLRYNFKPESIDNENAGTLTPKPGGDGHTFELERPSLQNGDNHRFTAVEQPSKEWECVLLWDPFTQQLTLEKLESTLNLHHEGRGKGTRPSSATPPSAPGSSRSKRTSNISSAAARDQELEQELDETMMGYSDAEGEPDEEVEIQTEIEAAAGVPTKEEEEEEEEEMEAVDVAPPPPPPPAKVKTSPKPKPKPKPRARPSANAKREREYDDVEEEVLTFGEPTKKRPRRSSATYSSTTNSTGLALPAPPPQNHHAPPTPSELLQPPSTAHITYAGSESDPDSDDSDDGGQELGEALDAAALELELEQELAGDEGDDDEGMEPVPLEDEQLNTGRPLSLNELFGGQSQDDDSSSDDSDDD